MEEAILTNWQHFQLFYVMIRGGSWQYLFIGHAIIATYGTLRFVWAYATASRIGAIHHSSHFLWLAEWILYLTLYNEKERKQYEDGNREADGKSKHLSGTGVDLLAWTVLGLILIFFWPVLLPILLLFVPIQASHLHFKRKKTFIANLKGEQLE